MGRYRTQSDWRAAKARAVDHTARIVAQGGYRRCEAVGAAGVRCNYGAGHTLEHHSFDVGLKDSAQDVDNS